MKEKMKNKYLIIPNKKEEIEKLSEYKILYPLKSFSIGFNYYYNVDEIITDNAFIYINRMLTSFEIDNLKEILNSLPKNIIGIVVEDLGLYEIIKDYPLEKIFYGSHILTNEKTVNAYLKYFDSCVVSPDITKEEVNNIIKSSDKKICLFGYGHMNLSYSRRLLNTNYAKNYKLENNNNLYVKNTDYEFILSENEYGTITYDKDIYSCLEENFDGEILYFIINLFEIDVVDFLDNNLSTTRGFLDKPTFYKVKGD